MQIVHTLNKMIGKKRRKGGEKKMIGKKRSMRTSARSGTLMMRAPPTRSVICSPPFLPMFKLALHLNYIP